MSTSVILSAFVGLAAFLGWAALLAHSDWAWRFSQKDIDLATVIILVLAGVLALFSGLLVRVGLSLLGAA